MRFVHDPSVNREGLLEKFYHGGLTSIVPG